MLEMTGSPDWENKSRDMAQNAHQMFCLREQPSSLYRSGEELLLHCWMGQ